MKNKGFTLIELLAVIVILAIIALISMPLILGVIEKVRLEAYKRSLVGILDAVDIYVATHNFDDFPEEGIDIMNPDLLVKNKDFVSGKIIKNEEGEFEFDQVTNGEYCGGGTVDSIDVVLGDCDQLDDTPPIVTLFYSSITSNSITIVADADDPESGISGYKFSKDNGLTWTDMKTSNVYAFSGLFNNTEYVFKVKTYNNKSLSTTSDSLAISTTSIMAPTYSIDIAGWSQSKVVTINYPDREEGYIYEYSLDGASTWEEVASPATTKEITFNANGSVIARISDGVNEVSASSYEVANIDNTPPVITVNPTTVTIVVGSTYTDSGVTAVDTEMGDITNDIVTTGSVDTSTVGTYLLHYNVNDAAGNAAVTVHRNVNVILPTLALNNAVNEYITIGSSPLRATADGYINLYKMDTDNYIYLESNSSMFTGYMPEKTEVKLVVDYINTSGLVIESRDVLLHQKGTSWSDWTIEWNFSNWGSFPKTSLLVELGARPTGTSSYKIYFVAQHDSYNGGAPYKNLILNTSGYNIPILQKYVYNYSVNDYRHWFWTTGSATFSSQFIVYRDMNYNRLIAYSADANGNVPRGVNNTGDGDYFVQLYMNFTFDGKRHSWYAEKYNYGLPMWEVGKIDYDNFGSGIVTLEHADTPPGGSQSVYYEYNNQERPNLVQGTMD